MYSHGFPSKRLTVCPTSRKFRIVVKGLEGTAMVSSGAFDKKYTTDTAKLTKCRLKSEITVYC